jgi:predicted Zn-dependent peptidase
MSSVLFQNVREFRSLAYSTNGRPFFTSLPLHPQETLGYITATGTQADKTLQAIATIDSLIREMPMKEENLEAARQSVLNDIQIEFPSFRMMTKYVANKMRLGYDSNPYTTLTQQLPSISSQDIIEFHRRYIAGNQNRVWFIVGDKKQTDMRALARFGKVVELKKEEIYR